MNWCCSAFAPRSSPGLLPAEPSSGPNGTPIPLLLGESSSRSAESGDRGVVGEKIDVDAADQIVAQLHVAAGRAVVGERVGPVGELGDEYFGDDCGFAFG